MAPDEIAPLLSRRPFVPLRFHLSDGHHYDVLKPEFTMLLKTSLLIGVRRNVDSPYFDEPVFLNLGQLTRVEPLVEQMAAPPAGA
jgi:hypothetical protein